MGCLQVFLDGGEPAHYVRRRGSHRMGTRHVRFPVFLAAYHVQCLQKSDSSWVGGDPIPVNTLYAVPTLASPSASNASLLATGTNDVLYIGGWLDLSKGPQVLHVPDMAGRYYSVQFTDPSDGTNFAYVGKRTTGTEAGDYLVSGPGWKGAVSQAMTQIASPHNSVLVFGRVFVESDSDLPTAYGLASQIQLTELRRWQPGH